MVEINCVTFQTKFKYFSVFSTHKNAWNSGTSSEFFGDTWIPKSVVRSKSSCLLLPLSPSAGITYLNLCSRFSPWNTHNLWQLNAFGWPLLHEKDSRSRPQFSSFQSRQVTNHVDKETSLCWLKALPFGLSLRPGGFFLFWIDSCNHKPDLDFYPIRPI